MLELLRYKPKIYFASKIRHAPWWRILAETYKEEIIITSRWARIDGPDHNTTFWTEQQKELHWIQDIQDVRRSDWLLAYCDGDKDDPLLAGTLVEIGTAIALGIPVCACGFKDRHSWQAHPLVKSFAADPHVALAWISGGNP